MTNLTLTINDSAAHKARLVAQRRRMTVDAVQGLIEQLDIEDKDAGNRACEALERSFREIGALFGGKLYVKGSPLACSQRIRLVLRQKGPRAFATAHTARPAQLAVGESDPLNESEDWRIEKIESQSWTTRMKAG